jgi:hypothetical protein
MKYLKNNELIFHSLLILGAIYLLLTTGSNLYSQEYAISGLSLLTIVILSSFSLFRSLKGSNRSIKFTIVKSIKLLIIMILFFVYVVAFDSVGFFVSTSIFIPFVMLFLGNRNPKQILGALAGVNLSVYLILVKLLGLQL